MADRLIGGGRYLLEPLGLGRQGGRVPWPLNGHQDGTAGEKLD